LERRFGFGEAIGGLLILAITTNLPEIAITTGAAVSGDLGIAIGNILGGIAIQTMVLVLLDASLRNGPPLTYRSRRGPRRRVPGCRPFS
jgi:cation:H+ antiporter